MGKPHDSPDCPCAACRERLDSAGTAASSHWRAFQNYLARRYEWVRPRPSLYSSWVVFSPSELPGAWTAHALEFDVITQGNSPEHTYQMALEAVEMVLTDDIARGADPFARRAPDEYWDRLFDLREHGEKVDPSMKLSELMKPPRPFAALVMFRSGRDQPPESLWVGEVPSQQTAPGDDGDPNRD